MTITPNTTIILLKSPLTLDNENQITFSNATAQANYFLSLPKIEVDANTYQRANSFIRFSGNYDDLIGYNYCMYKNEDYNNKWFYAFITGKEYINGSVTNVYLKQDVFQSWQFDIIYKKSFVEREHVNDDTIGLHTIEEGLGVGDIIAEDQREETSLSNEYGYYIGVLTTYDLENNKDYPTGVRSINGNVYGENLIIVGNSAPAQDLGLYLNEVNGKGKIESIHNIFIIPMFLINEANLENHDRTLGDWNYTYYTLNGTARANYTSIEWNIPKLKNFNDIAIKNSKCFTYPYNYLMISNGNGAQHIYRYEDFLDENNATFLIDGCISIGNSIKMLPFDYKIKNVSSVEYTDNRDETVTLSKYPTCSWTSDAYVNWLTQNAVNIGTDTAKIFTSFAGGFSGADASGNASLSEGVSTGANVVYSVANLYDRFRQADLLNNMEGGQASGDIDNVSGRINFVAKRMRCKKEIIKQIDDFFTMFGYKVNELKIPNITGRANHNYIKTTVCNILGNIPQEDLQELKTIFNNGVTLWHNTANFLNYDANNNII